MEKVIGAHVNTEVRGTKWRSIRVGFVGKCQSLDFMLKRLYCILVSADRSRLLICNRQSYG